MTAIWCRKAIFVGVVATLVATVGVGRGQAQTAPSLVLLDRAVVGHVPAAALNEAIADVGVREPLPYFAARVGDEVLLPAAQWIGWYALAAAPAAWDSEPGAGDGLQNFLLAGPGLGSPDADGSRTAGLVAVPDVSPIGVDGLGARAGKTVCAVVYDGALALAPGGGPTDLSGPTLGVAALSLGAVTTDATGALVVPARVLDVRLTCGGFLVP